MRHLPKLNRGKIFISKISNIVFTIFVLIILPKFVYAHPADSNYLQLSRNHLFYETKENFAIDIASDNNFFTYLSFPGGKIISVDLTNNQKRWEAELGGQIISTPSSFGENIYLVGKSETTLTVRSLAKSTGITQSQINIPFEEQKISAVEKVFLYKFENQIVLVVDNGEVFSLNADNGQITWRESLGQQLSTVPYLIQDKLFLGTFGKQIIGLSLSNGRQIVNFVLLAPPTFITQERKIGFLLVGDKNGFLSVFDWLKNSQIRKFRLGGEISSIAHTSRGLLISSFDNFIYLLASSGNKVIWKKRLAGRIAAAPQFNENFVIVATTEATAASVIDLRNGKLFDKIVLPKNDFFTGKNLRSGKFFIYLTKAGVLSFSLAEGR